ncbi:hypothetical protein [Enterococcus casseliflavus]|uniref:hypothetical protein n=1 Tax=Enterococcus casseliflavus TaxID=37734 RepID=UPI001CA95F45|nr:hypothetical protein [Enterococcus casseliflavus]MBZ0323606.1 hypothetical protein [Enterococcus casseliflavus]
MELKVRCFHCGDEDSVNKFCENDEFLPISNHPYDNHWAGPGMYLWDNLANARWWKSTRRDTSKRIISKCILEIDEDDLLDMTNSDLVEAMDGLVHIMMQSEQVPTSNEVGIKIAYIANYFDSKAIKLFGYYPSQEENAFIGEVNKSKAHVSMAPKVIYCVREGKFDVLKNRELEEVI